VIEADGKVESSSRTRKMELEEIISGIKEIEELQK
jgi:hypothetical protein